MTARRLHIILHSAALAAGAIGLAACSNRGPLTVNSNDPAVEIPAMQADVRNHNPADEPQMVHDLESDDPAIRFYAIESLRRLTGTDLGYHCYDTDDARHVAVARWKLWLTQQGKPR